MKMPGSNVDLLIIEKESFGPNRSRREEISRIRNASRTFRVPKDVIVYSKEEMEKWKDSANHIAGRGVREGRWLYERS
ncbi:hypothetical protein GWO43_17735 [candidate division KSB1 bacterium]|nr:hypothetical protein [candidate division KSB1 bacterium]NIT72678.1 hypothetical protein [candidate division KSB1 bacterium]NIU26493.1 hypothetical protein [candidate division KSB1 bacterium]NIW20350.1 hypothetical protein [candidate division KSB1 bacterium]NIW70849.1 hypothetical protein [candidate division KSB1 bacterium]